MSEGEHGTSPMHQNNSKANEQNFEISNSQSVDRNDSESKSAPIAASKGCCIVM